MNTSGVPKRWRMPLVASANARAPSSRANASSWSAMTARIARASAPDTSAAGDAAAQPKARSASTNSRTMPRSIGRGTGHRGHAAAADFRPGEEMDRFRGQGGKGRAMKRTITAVVAVVLLAACQTTTGQTPRATAKLEPTQGNKTVGEATFEQVGGKLRVVVLVQGLRPDQEHGFHIHEVGDCSSGDGMSAKGNFNPFGKPHGNPGGPERHAGDLPSLRADKDGRAKIAVEVDLITLTDGPGNIIGRGLIVHADPDDYRTQPTGNAGARLACGVIRA